MSLPDYSQELLSTDLIDESFIPRPSWHEYFMAMAKVVSTRSTCNSRPVGCVITLKNRILVTGYNGAPPGEPHCVDHNQGGVLYCRRRAEGIPDQLKHGFCNSLHAEENALAFAEKLGLQEMLKGATLYTTLSPCIRCIQNLVKYGVTNVYYELEYRSVDKNRDDEWRALAKESFQIYENLLVSHGSSRKILKAISATTSQRILPSE
jgi:dCMP deaminase